MKIRYFLGGAALALTSALAIAQDAPESLLPKMFQDPQPSATRTPASRPSPRTAPSPRTTPSPRSTPAAAPAAAASSAPRAVSTPMVQSLPTDTSPDDLAGLPLDVAAPQSALVRIPSLEELERMTSDDFETILSSRLVTDMPPQARRDPGMTGLLDESEGGMRADSLSGESAGLIRLAMEANRGNLVSRWGHILLRRALASRLQPPTGMNAGDFVALRVALLLRMGEVEAARAVLQQLDIADYTPATASLVVDLYARNADFTGLCPILATQGSLRDDPAWNISRTICQAFRGNSAAAITRLDRDLSRGTMPKMDLLLAQKYAGAAGKSRRAVTIEWSEVPNLSPWRYGLALGVGLEPPAKLVADAGPEFAYITALAPMASLTRRASAADLAAANGVLSNSALVDLYSQIYADSDTSGEWQDRAESLRDAYTLEDAKERLSAMQTLWKGATGQALYGRQILTAAAAARVTPTSDLADNAADLIAAMLAAGYDANAQRWASVVKNGSQGWALIMLASPGRTGALDTGALDTFISDDESANKRKSALLVAGLAGLQRIANGDAGRYSGDMALKLDSATRWTRAIDDAAARGDAAGVALLAGFGMQGDGWVRMTPRYLFHIVSALRQVGLEAEARMIAAEAVARV
ncbi:hypothetical protein WSK_1005 [Novosphingobium sp. Rr 2-17]|uniref:hypothetical protein n=1 Tax=Novosphingobium sp. Rr 2-17 TaxID=555793 RepID=UPI0002699830|nr:hypothetical protein [Novosphingobium sp. Rr 2-17]EIZ80447.1 hypothetical protein WSK_1005 [Novosphingobium sp. Rr 2-17]